MKKSSRRSAAVIATAATVAGLLAAGGFAPAANASATLIGPLRHTKVIASTIPADGDVNPYGVAAIPRDTGALHQGNVLVSDFNNKANGQGTGTTIAQVSPRGKATLFAHVTDRACPGGVGLTTALVALRAGWVIVGSLPTRKGAISGPGCLIVLDQRGHVRETIARYGIDGPWDMAALDWGSTTELFVTNVLGGILGRRNPNGGTVQRLLITSTSSHVPRVLASTRIGSGFPARTDPNALVIGPTGVDLAGDGTLYIADTLRSRIASIPDAVFRHNDVGAGLTVSKAGALKSPLGLAVAPNGHILTVNGGNGNMVETAPGGAQLAVVTVDKHFGGAGNLFGLAVKPGAAAVYFVDDFSAANNLQLLF
jgi:hypothetical protein